MKKKLTFKFFNNRELIGIVVSVTLKYKIITQ